MADATLTIATAEGVAALGATVQLAVLDDDESAPEIEPAPDAEERPTRPRAASAAADGAGPPRKTQRGSKPRTVTARVLDHLAKESVDDPGGHAMAKLADAIEAPRGAVGEALRVLEADGKVIRVKPSSHKTTRIELAERPKRRHLQPVESIKVEGRKPEKAAPAPDAPKPTMEFHEGEVVEEVDVDIPAETKEQREQRLRDAAADGAYTQGLRK